MTTELATMPPPPVEPPAATLAPAAVQLTPQDRIEQNKDLIKLLAPDVQRHHLSNINGKRYMNVGGGIAVANASGYAVSVSRVEFDKPTGMWEAAATLHCSSTGAVIATAVGYVGDDESRWMNGPKAARNSMTQTRAEAKLCRANFGHLYILLGASTDTPAEEMSNVRAAASPPPVAQPAPASPVNEEQGTGRRADLYTVTEIEEFTGVSKAGKDFTKWTIHTAEGIRMVTFRNEEKVHADKAMVVAGGQLQAELKGPNQWGTYDIKSIRCVQEGPLKAKDTVEDDDIPF